MPVATGISAGVARTDITPPLGIAHAGWGAQTHQRAASVDLPLWATALALSDGERTVVIIDIDTMYLFEREAATARAAVAELTGLPAAHIRLSYTHTHSGPVSGSGWTSWMDQGAEMVGPYDDGLPHRLAGVAWAAVQAMRPVRIGAGRGRSAIAVNRRFQRPEDGAIIVGRNWDGPVDHDVLVVRIDAIDGRPLATIVNYACHPITVGPDCESITPDYPGVVRRVVEEATGSTCLFLQGTAGDIGPIRGVACNGQNEYRRLGAMLGHEASRVWWELEVPERTERYLGTLESGAPLAIYADEPVAEQDWTLRVISREVALPARQIGDAGALTAESESHIARLNALRTAGGTAEEIRQATMLAKRATMRAALAHDLAGRTDYRVEIHGIGLGSDIALVAMAAEPFVEIGRQIKRDSPFPYTLVSGYVNLTGEYLPTAEAYPLGGYEIEVTPFAPEAASQIVQACREMLNDLRGGDRGSAP